MSQDYATNSKTSVGVATDGNASVTLACVSFHFIFRFFFCLLFFSFFCVFLSCSLHWGRSKVTRVTVGRDIDQPTRLKLRQKRKKIEKKEKTEGEKKKRQEKQKQTKEKKKEHQKYQKMEKIKKEGKRSHSAFQASYLYFGLRSMRHISKRQMPKSRRGNSYHLAQNDYRFNVFFFLKFSLFFFKTKTKQTCFF